VKTDGKKKDGTQKHRPIKVTLESREAWLSIMRAKHALKTNETKKLTIGEQLSKLEQERKAKRWPDFIAKRDEGLWVQWRRDVVWYRTPPSNTTNVAPAEIGVMEGGAEAAEAADYKWRPLKVYACDST
jgi:hypothetical protein